MMSVFYNIGFSRGVCGNKATETLNRLYYSIESARKQGFAGGRGKRDGADADPGSAGSTSGGSTGGAALLLTDSRTLLLTALAALALLLLGGLLKYLQYRKELK